MGQRRADSAPADPSPRCVPRYSGRMSIQVPEDLEARLRQLAAAQGITVDELVTKELSKLVVSRPVRALRGKGVLHAGSSAPYARDLKAYMRGEADDA
nr:toxin-antitoxin system HicB family antitoxin [Streptomyces melanosporofaciens]